MLRGFDCASTAGLLKDMAKLLWRYTGQPERSGSIPTLRRQVVCPVGLLSLKSPVNQARSKCGGGRIMTVWG